MHLRCLVLACTLPVLPFCLPAQDGATAPTVVSPAASMDLRRQVAVTRDGVAVTARGWDYDAVFTAGGGRFVPVLGARAPSTQHLAWQPLAFGRASGFGDASVVATGPCAPETDGAHCVVYRHAPGAIERFDVTPAGVQLSWQFPAPLPGTGDLVVRYRIDTTLALAATSPTGVSFRLAGVGGVDIGAVTGIDANGRRMAGELRLTGDVLELRLPTAFVGEAAYPLTLDPLLSTQFGLGVPGDDDGQPDVAYDSTHGNYLMVWRRVYSSSSAVIMSQLMSGNGVAVGVSQVISGLGFLAGRPTVANVRLRESFLVAWQHSASLLAPREIHAVAVHAGTGVRTPHVVVAAATSDNGPPDAAGENGTDDEALVAYVQAGVGVRVALVNIAAPATVPVLQSTITVSTNPTAREPAISKSVPSALRYVVVWGEEAAGTPRLRARAMNRNGGLLGSEVTVASSPGLDVAVPDVDGNGVDFLVVYDPLEPGTGAGLGARDVVCQRVTWTGNSLALGASRVLAATATTDQKQPAVAFCRYKFLVAWADQLWPGSNNYDVLGAELGADCNACGGVFRLTGTNSSLLRNVEHWPAIASKASGGAADDDALVLFAEADDAPPFGSNLVGQRVDLLGPGGAIVAAGTACGSAGTIGTTGGPFAVGNTDFAVTATGLQAGVLPFLAVGFRGNEPSCGSCQYVDFFLAEFVLPVGSTANYPIRLPCSAYPMVGFTLQVQWLVFGTSSSPCPSVASLSMTNRLHLPLVP